MTVKSLLAWSLPVLAGCASSPLTRLAVDGPKLHASLVTRKIDDVSRLHVPGEVLHGNPYLSTDAKFVEVIAAAASQGQLGAEGIRAALYSLYLGEGQVGLYGLAASSTADADRRERAMREIWAYGEGLGFMRVHRAGKVLVVVWHDGVSPECWEAVNARVAQLLAGR